MFFLNVATYSNSLFKEKHLEKFNSYLAKQNFYKLGTNEQEQSSG